MKSINYKGKEYILDEDYFSNDMLNTTSQFQYEQLLYCIEIQDFITLENRINNMIKWGGIKLK
jgi:hypothetical protein